MVDRARMERTVARVRLRAMRMGQLSVANGKLRSRQVVEHREVMATPAVAAAVAEVWLIITGRKAIARSMNWDRVVAAVVLVVAVATEESAVALAEAV